MFQARRVSYWAETARNMSIYISKRRVRTIISTALPPIDLVEVDCFSILSQNMSRHTSILCFLWSFRFWRWQGLARKTCRPGRRNSSLCVWWVSPMGLGDSFSLMKISRKCRKKTQRSVTCARARRSARVHVEKQGRVHVAHAHARACTQFCTQIRNQVIAKCSSLARNQPNASMA